MKGLIALLIVLYIFLTVAIGDFVIGSIAYIIVIALSVLLITIKTKCHL